MREIMLTVLIISMSGSFAFAQANVQQPNRARLQDGKIVVDTPRGTNAVNYRGKRKYQAVSPRRWRLEQQKDPVTEALRVYEEKSKPLYEYRVFLSYRNRQEPSIVFSYTSTEEDSGVIFSPDEKYLYYIDVSDNGTHIVHGLHLKTATDFEIAVGNDIDFVRCPGKEYYLVIEDDSDVSYHAVYRSTGERVNMLNKREDIDALVPFICY